MQDFEDVEARLTIESVSVSKRDSSTQRESKKVLKAFVGVMRLNGWRIRSSSRNQGRHPICFTRLVTRFMESLLCGSVLVVSAKTIGMFFDPAPKKMLS